MPTDGTEANEALGRAVTRLMDQAGIGVRELARRTRELAARDNRFVAVDRTSISELRRGIPPRPNAAMLVSIARVLGTDPYDLLRLAGVSLPAALADVEPQTASIAQRLSELPGWLREMAVPAVLDLVTMLEHVAAARNGAMRQQDETAALAARWTEDQLRDVLLWIKRHNPDLWRELSEGDVPPARRASGT